VQVVRVAAQSPAEAADAFRRIPGVSRVEHAGDGGRLQTYRLQLAEDRDIGEAVFQVARERGFSLAELRRDDKTLEQVFRELTESRVGVAA
jgi:hypothetical protein